MAKSSEATNALDTDLAGQSATTEAELRRAKEVAENSLAQWRTVVGNMSEGLVVADPQGNLIDWNKAALVMHGFDHVEQVRKHLHEFPKTFELSTPEGKVLPVEQWPMSRVLGGENFSNMELRVFRKDIGLDLIISYSGGPVTDRDGKVTLALLTLHDVTIERRAQQALRQSADRLSLALAAADLGDWSWDAATDMMTMSPRAAEIFGIAAGSHMTREKMREIIHPDFREAANLASRRAAEERGDYDMEYPICRADGKQLWVAAKGRGQYDAGGNIIGMLGVVQDITGRKRVEEEIKTSERRYRLLTELSPQMVWQFRADGSAEYVNRFWSDYTGLPAEHHIDWRKIVHPDDLAESLKKLKGAIEEGKSFELVQRLCRAADKMFRWHMVRVQPLAGEDHRPAGWMGIAWDIHEIRVAAEERAQLLEAERAARTEAERVSKMKDEFLATLSHELRTPLNAILGWSQILRTSPDKGDLAQGLETIERNARVQTQLIEDLLDMSRIISGKIRLDVQRVDLTNVILAAVDAVMPAANAKSIRVRKVLDPAAGPISGDPGRMQQVVWNLLSNAIKFTPKGGRVEVLLQRINSHVEITVTDTGQGINPEFLPHVFERFRQADASTTRKHGGLGLGLSIVKQLVQLHGGSVRVSSPGEGEGATFSVALPLAITRHDDPDRQHPTAVRHSAFDCEQVSLDGIKVLVVDDEPDARELVRRVLIECNAEVITVDSAREAKRALQREKPDVMVSDIGMPHKDGYELMREVRALPADSGGRTPAVALTAFARSEDRTRAMMAGYQVHLSKPIEPQELVATVASLAGRTGQGSHTD
jgi:PAS domain S-box-containing protein